MLAQLPPSISEEPVTIAVYPPIFELELEKGQSYQNKVLLRNKSELAIPIETDVVNFTAKDEFGGISFEIHETDTKKEHETDAKKWFKIEKPDFILEPKGSERIKFKIDVPKDVGRGGYYGTILFKSKLPSYYFEKDYNPPTALPATGGAPAAKAIPQIGVLFLISVGKGGKADFEIVEFGIPEEKRIKILEKLSRNILGGSIIVDGSLLPFNLRVKNNDIYHMKPSGILEIYKFAENCSPQNLIGRTEIKETTILPGKIRQFSIEFQPDLFEKLNKFLPKFLAGFVSENLFLGKYKVFLKLHGSAEVEKEMDIWIFPFKGIIILLLLGFIISFIIMKYTKQTRKNKDTEKRKKKVVLS